LRIRHWSTLGSRYDYITKQHCFRSAGTRSVRPNPCCPLPSCICTACLRQCLRLLSILWERLVRLPVNVGLNNSISSYTIFHSSGLEPARQSQQSLPCILARVLRM
jgi:hypothetical protein